MERSFRIHVQLVMHLLVMVQDNVKMVCGHRQLQHANVCSIVFFFFSLKEKNSNAIETNLFNLILDVDCGELPTLDHGAILLLDHRSSFGAKAQYSCHENYTLIGNENRTCEMTGWSGKQPQCLVDWCPDPVQIAGGQVQISGKRAGATATYQCEPGYVLIGEPVRIHISKLLSNYFIQAQFIYLFEGYIVWIGW